MVGRTFAIVIAAAVLLAAIWFGIAQYQQARSSTEAARLNEQAARQAAVQTEAAARLASMQDTELAEAVKRDVDARDDQLAAFRFLIGTWRGEKDGGLVEEIWSKPEGNAMMGMFRWLNADGLSRMYELLTISREGDETYLRLRHFTSAMVAWEEKDAPVVLKLTESSDRRAVFVNANEEDRLERIVFHQPDAEQLRIDVEFREGSGRGPLNFRFDAAR